MKAEHVNAFLVPSVQVLRKMARTEVSLGQITRLAERSESPAGGNLSIIIGLEGRLSGSVIFTTSREIALALSARICGQEPGAMGEQDVRAVMAELANTVVGNATGMLFDIGIKTGITPPTVVLGPQVSFGFDSGVESIQVPLQTEAGTVDMVVSLTRDTI